MTIQTLYCSRAPGAQVCDTDTSQCLKPCDRVTGLLWDRMLQLVLVMLVKHGLGVFFLSGAVREHATVDGLWCGEPTLSRG